MAKAKRPRFRVNDRVSLAPHTPLIPAYGGKPFVGRDTILRVSSVVGKGTLRDPWGVNITDDAGHFWHLQPGDIVPRHNGESHARKKSSAQLDREIAETLGARPINKRKRVRHFSEWRDKTGAVHYAVTYEDLSGHAITRDELQRYRRREAKESR